MHLAFAGLKLVCEESKLKDLHFSIICVSRLEDDDMHELL